MLTNKVVIAGELVLLLAPCLGLLYWFWHRPREQSFEEWFASQDPRRHGGDES